MHRGRSEAVLCVFACLGDGTRPGHIGISQMWNRRPGQTMGCCLAWTMWTRGPAFLQPWGKGLPFSHLGFPSVSLLPNHPSLCRAHLLCSKPWVLLIHDKLAVCVCSDCCRQGGQQDPAPWSLSCASLKPVPVPGTRAGLHLLCLNLCISQSHCSRECL